MATKKPFYTPAEIIDQVKVVMASLAPDAFRHNGRVQLYSGPKKIISAALLLLKNDLNHARAFKQAARKTAQIIDKTAPCIFVNEYDVDPSGKEINIYDYYNEHYSKDPARAAAAANEVMAFVSEEFIKAAYGEVETAVCGADTNNIFYRVELPALVANKKVTSINGLPMDMVRDIFVLDPYEAFRVVCIAELHEAKEHAQKTGNADDMADYKMRRNFFLEERKGRRAGFLHPAPETKLAIRNILKTYRMGALQEEIAGDEHPSRPVAAPAPQAVATAGKPKAP